MGAFDDLIPQTPAGNGFDDLIPKAAAPADPVAPAQNVSRETSPQDAVQDHSMFARAANDLGSALVTGAGSIAPGLAIPPGAGLKSPLGYAQQYLDTATGYANQPNILDVAGEAGRRGAVNMAVNTANSARVAAGQPVDATPPPPDNSPVGKLLQEKIGAGWSDPNWWAAQIAQSTAESSPMMAGAFAGEGIGKVTGLPWQGQLATTAAGGALGAGFSSLGPHFQQGLQDGLTPRDAFDRAWEQTGVDAGVAALFPAVSKIPLFGTVSKTLENGQVAETLKRPIAAAMAKIFGIDPSLMVANQAANTAISGKPQDIQDLATTGITGAIQGAGMHFMGTSEAPPRTDANGNRVAGSIGSPGNMVPVEYPHAADPTLQAPFADLIPPVPVAPHVAEPAQIHSVADKVAQPISDAPNAPKAAYISDVYDAMKSGNTEPLAAVGASSDEPIEAEPVDASQRFGAPNAKSRPEYWPEWGDTYPDYAKAHVAERQAAQAFNSKVEAIQYPNGVLDPSIERWQAQQIVKEQFPDMAREYDDARAWEYVLRQKIRKYRGGVDPAQDYAKFWNGVLSTNAGVDVHDWFNRPEPAGTPPASDSTILSAIRDDLALQDKARMDMRIAQERAALSALPSSKTEPLAAVGASVPRDHEIDDLGFYSNALEAARNLKQAKGTPEQMRAQLKNAGVKDSELAATGLDDLLQGRGDDRTGGSSSSVHALTQITRDQIISHLEDNRVGLEETQYGGKPGFPGEGQPMFASSVNTAGKAKLALMAGQTFNRPEPEAVATHAQITDAAKRLPVLPNTKIGTLDRITPIKGSDNVLARFRLTDGNYKTVSLSKKLIQATRAMFLGSETEGSGFLASTRLGDTSKLGNTLSGELWHELTHSKIAAGDLWGADLNRLVRHSKDLRVIAMDHRDYLTNIGDHDGAAKVPPGISLFDTYSDLYAGRNPADAEGRMTGESVAHMIELWKHGVLTDEQMAPVRDLLNKYFSEKSAPSGRSEAKGESAQPMAAAGVKTGTANHRIEGGDSLISSLRRRINGTNARAREMGFDTSVTTYRGTRFGDAARETGMFSGGDKRQGPLWFSDSKPVAKTYANSRGLYDKSELSPLVAAVHLRVKNPMVVDFEGKRYDNGPGGVTTEGLAAEAQKSGHDGFVFKNVRDDATGFGKPTTVRGVFDPRNVRSVNAAFDPAESSSANLMAAAGPGGKSRLGKSMSEIDKEQSAGSKKGIETAIQGRLDLAPQTLTSEIRKMGGIKDTTGELRQILDKPGTKGHIPGIINNRTGVDPDRMREHLVQQGFLHEPDPSAPPRTTVNDVYDLVARAAHGERVVPAGQEHIAEPTKAGEHDEIVRAAQNLLEDHGMGYDLTDAEERKFVKLVQGGMSLDAALERVGTEGGYELEQQAAARERGRTPQARAEVPGRIIGTETGRGAGAENAQPRESAGNPVQDPQLEAFKDHLTDLAKQGAIKLIPAKIAKGDTDAVAKARRSSIIIDGKPVHRIVVPKDAGESTQPAAGARSQVSGGNGGGRPPLPPGGGGGGEGEPPKPRLSSGTQPPSSRPLNQNKYLTAWKRTFQPELISDRALMADPLFRKYNASRAQQKDAIVHEGDAIYDRWAKTPVQENLDFINRVERGQAQRDPWQQEQATRYRKLLDEATRMEHDFGSRAAYISDYFPHAWKNPVDARQKFQALYDMAQSGKSKQVGPTWFQKARTIDLINTGLNMGLELKSTNPEEIVASRLMSGVDMRERVSLLREMQRMGLALPEAGANPRLVRNGWLSINAPDRQKWLIAPDIQPIWKNAVEAKGLWGDEGALGDGFRKWMAYKNFMVPLKLALSLFHPLHVLHINMSEGLARSFSLAQAGRFSSALSNLRTAFNVNPGVGHDARSAWLIPADKQTPMQRSIVKLMQDGGFVPQMSEQMKIGARRALSDALAKQEWLKIGPLATRRAIEKLQTPIFEKWIPNLKAAAYINDAHALFERRPDLLNDPDQMRLALSAIGKSVDNRFGEMFYSNVFWNRTIKDITVGGFLSLGWNLGFARELGGGMVKAGRLLGETARVLSKPSPTRQVIRDANNKMANIVAYATTAMAINALMTYGLSGQSPQGLDYIFPRIGGKNPDGTDRRVTNMFYTREVPMMAKHIEDQGGGVTGTLAGARDMLWNKTMLEPYAEILNNRDYYGYNIFDPQSPVYKQAWQLFKHVATDSLSPITISGAGQAAAMSGHPIPPISELASNPGKYASDLGASATAKGVGLSMLGFGPAPAYAEHTALENRIGHLYNLYVKPTEKTADAAASKPDQDAAKLRLRLALQKQDKTGIDAARTAALNAGVSPKALAGMASGTPFAVYAFSRLSKDLQSELMDGMSPAELKVYAPHANMRIRAQYLKAVSQQSSTSP